MTLKAGFNEVFFTDVTIPEGNIVGKRGEGWAVQMQHWVMKEAP